MLGALRAADAGDFSVRLPARRSDPLSEIADPYNQLVEKNAAMAEELDRIGTVVGREGRIRERAALSSAQGSWRRASSR